MRALFTVMLVLAVAAPAADAAPIVIKPGKYGVSAIGGYKPKKDATVGAAKSAFGEATGLKPNGAACAGRWNAIGLKIVFANFGGTEGDDTTCTDDVGLGQSFKARGPDFESWKGLKVGDSAAKVRSLHPAARRHRTSYWLRAATSQFGEGGTYAVVKANLAGGTVTGFAGWIGAAGE